MPFVRARTRKQLLTTCSILRELGDTFSAAMLMVGLAEQTVHEMDKAYTSMASAQNHPSTISSNNLQPHNTQTLQRFTKDKQTATAHNIPEAQVAIQQSDDRADADQGQTMNEFDPNLLFLMPDLDIFNHFDPDFDLDAIDAAFGGNIVPAFAQDNLAIDFGSIT
jgi:long-subunit fatty acid transport protein